MLRGLVSRRKSRPSHDLRDFAVLAIVIALGGGAPCRAQESPAAAEERHPSTSSAQVQLTGALCVPPQGGVLGFAYAGELAYGLRLRGLALAPGLRVASYFSADEAAVAGLVMLRSALLRGLYSPFVAAGVGPGYRSEAATWGPAFAVSAGLMLDLSSRFSIGGEASYIQVAGGRYRQLSLGPALLVRL